MTLATAVLDTAFTVGPVRPRLFGSFVEHMGRCVYTGIYEAEHPRADQHGFREDVAELVRELGVSLVRYPGGNFVSGYDWTDGIGPVSERPVRPELAWGSLEPNEVGTDEFLAWCERLGVEPMLAVNLGTRGVAEALQLLEYCNGPAGTSWADRRIANGRAEPWDVRLWCLGNEMDGAWQIGRKTPQAYAELAEQTARAMRRLDPGLELVACGSSGPTIETFGRWERTVLRRLGDVAQHVSLHLYYEPDPDDRASFLSSGHDMGRYVDDVVSVADAVAAEDGTGVRTTLSFDEWNVWYPTRGAGYGLEERSSSQTPSFPRPIAEDDYSADDAVLVGSMLMTLLSRTDRVAMACQAQLVNVLGLITTRAGGPAWRQSIFHPFALTARLAAGVVLRPVLTSPQLGTGKWGQVDQVQLVATWEEEMGELCVFVVNRDPDHEVELEVALPREMAGAAGADILEHVAIAEPDPTVCNTEAEPDRVRPRQQQGATAGNGRLRATLPPASWHVVRLRVAPEDRSNP